MMKIVLCGGLALALLLPAHSLAGALYGTARQGAGPLRGARILVACPNFGSPHATAEAHSDDSGSFSLRVGATGRCEMRIERGGQAGPAFPVLVSDNPMRFDFAVDGSLNRAP
jgi:hypothetical protein